MASLSPALMAMIKGAKNKYSRSTGKALKLKEGKTKIRLLHNPAHDNPNLLAGQFWRDIGIHWIKMERNGKPVAVVGCRDHTYSEPCELCAAIEKAKASATDDETLALYKEWQARKSVLVVALIRSGPDASEDPQILEMTPTTFGTILSVMEEYGEDTNVLDLKEGIDFVIERKGKGLDTEYVVMPASKSEAVKKDVLDRMPNLDEFIEKEYFRGDEKKALTAIAQVTGLKLAPPAPRGTALLTSRGKVAEADVEDVDMETAPPRKPAAKAAAKPAPKVVEDEPEALPAEDLDSLLSELDDLEV